MNVITKGTILYYIRKYPKAKNAFLGWYQEFIKLDFQNFNQLKEMYGNASIVGDNRIIFNVKGNDFRLIISCNFQKRAAYIIWFGTHKEYDKIDAVTVPFNINKLNY